MKIKRPARLPNRRRFACIVVLLSSGMICGRIFADELPPTAGVAVKTTRAVYPFAGMRVEIVQSKALRSETDQYCRAEIRVLKDGSAISRRSISNFDPNGDVYGLFVPERQPSPDYFVIVKRGDYDGRTFIVDKNGRMKDLPGGAFWVVPDKGLLFSDSIQDDDEGPVIFDLRSGTVIRDQLPFYSAHWYRSGETLFFTTDAADGSEKEARSIIHVYDATTNKVSVVKPEQKIWSHAKVIDHGFNPGDRKISCDSTQR